MGKVRDPNSRGNEDSYRGEGKCHLVPVASIPKLDEHAQRACEAAYRRGYMQGGFEAFEAIRLGASLDDVSEWIHFTVSPWRYGHNPKHPAGDRSWAPTFSDAKGGE